MNLAAVLMLLAGAVLAALGVALAYWAARKDRAALAALADDRGWDHRAEAPADHSTLARRVYGNPAENPGNWRLLDHFAGPTPVGPFTLTRLRFSNPPTQTAREHTLVHIRTPLSSPGLHVAPSPEFRAGGSGPKEDRFYRLYDVKAPDEEFQHRALDPETRDFISAPRRTVRIDWLGRDLLIAIPLAARTPRAVDAFVSWSSALASRLNESHAPYRGRAAYRTARTTRTTHEQILRESGGRRPSNA